MHGKKSTTEDTEEHRDTDVSILCVPLCPLWFFEGDLACVICEWILERAGWHSSKCCVRWIVL